MIGAQGVWTCSPLAASVNMILISNKDATVIAVAFRRKIDLLLNNFDITPERY